MRRGKRFRYASAKSTPRLSTTHCFHVGFRTCLVMRLASKRPSSTGILWIRRTFTPTFSSSTRFCLGAMSRSRSNISCSSCCVTCTCSTCIRLVSAPVQAGLSLRDQLAHGAGPEVLSPSVLDQEPAEVRQRSLLQLGRLLHLRLQSLVQPDRHTVLRWPGS